MPEWLDTLLIIYIPFGIFIGAPLCMAYCVEYDTPFLMGHKFKTIEWHGKIIIVLLNILFAPVLIVLNILYAIVNVFVS